MNYELVVSTQSKSLGKAIFNLVSCGRTWWQKENQLPRGKRRGLQQQRGYSELMMSRRSFRLFSSAPQMGALWSLPALPFLSMYLYVNWAVEVPPAVTMEFRLWAAQSGKTHKQPSACGPRAPLDEGLWGITFFTTESP